MPLYAPERYESWLGIAPVFGSLTNRLRYRADVAEIPVADANPKLYRVLSLYMQKLVTAETEIQEGNLISAVRNNINRGLRFWSVTLDNITARR